MAQLPFSVQHLRRLAQGAAGMVYQAEANYAPIAIKVRNNTGQDLRIEARMLQLLSDAGWPTPQIYFASSELICMELIGNDHQHRSIDEANVAEMICHLHSHLQPSGRYGMSESNYLGFLNQANQWSPSWPDFFAKKRIELRLSELPELPLALRRQLNRVVDRIGDLIPSNPASSLIHGDLWSGNLLFRSGKLAGVIDPAPYYADREVELAFITMFHTFGNTFFDRYHQLQPISNEFWGLRRYVYNLYPILTHCVLYPGQYESQLEQALRQITAGW